MSDYEKFLDRMRTLSNEQLQEILAITFEDYTDVALEAAKAVLEERGIQTQVTLESGEFKDLNFKTFKDCIGLVDYAGVEEKLHSLFNEPDKHLLRYKEIYTQLRLMKPVENPDIKLFVAQIRDDIRQGYPFDVFGIEKGVEEYFGLEMFPWHEWLGFEIYEKTRAFVLNLGLEEFVAICLRKMTSLGMSEEEIEKRIEEMQSAGYDFFEGEDGDKIEV